MRGGGRGVSSLLQTIVRETIVLETTGDAWGRIEEQIRRVRIEVRWGAEEAW
jgi:hypothetical protein